MKKYCLILLTLLVCFLVSCSMLPANNAQETQVNEDANQDWKMWKETAWEKGYAEKGVNVQEIIREYIGSSVDCSNVADVKYSLI